MSDGLPLVALRGLVPFPGALTPVVIDGPAALRAVAEHVERGVDLILATLAHGATDCSSLTDLYPVACKGRVLRTLSMGDGTARALVEAYERVELLDLTPGEFWTARTRDFEVATDDPIAVEMRTVTLRASLEELLGSDLRRPGELREAPPDPDEGPDRLADYTAGMLQLPLPLQQALLGEPRLSDRLEFLCTEAAKALELVRLSNRIHDRVRQSIDRSQREYFLREQIRLCREELGEASTDDLTRLQHRLEAAGMPWEVLAEAHRELDRMRRMSADAAELSVARAWLDCLAEMPWNVTTVDDDDLASARAALDAEHHGLAEAKQRILEYLAVRQLNPMARGLILCFVGPPGTGKTSLARTVAHALGRRFQAVALGGVKDASEIRGHRRTYVGAMPGRIVQALRRAGTRNPVLLLDELDKVQAVSGDPAAALLEVLDSTQNQAFVDHYVDAPFDLSQTLFIATANVVQDIPPALYDRLETVHLPGYIEDEKVQIARKHLLPRVRASVGLDESQLRISNEALLALVRRWTLEPGVRGLERHLTRIFRGMALQFVEGRTRTLVVKEKHVERLLGPAPPRLDLAEQASRPGVAMGLAWTADGGEVLVVEALRFEGTGQLTLTGTLGETLRESVLAAISLVRSRAEGLGIEPATFTRSDFHVHLPGGGIHKDGPSAGLTTLVALTSLLLDRPVTAGLALTGEITLRGRVLAVGGIKEKLLAARRSGLSAVVLPKANATEFEGLPERLTGSLRIHLVETVDEALAHALQERGS
ncbi:MAG: endopeptidase La [Proteobacteria bacterium]|nr:endopeptidase La [Pseudomonadota bacterium]MCP4915460.1 endopeptidase La [Pseudomonadota bacterium]